MKLTFYEEDDLKGYIFIIEYLNSYAYLTFYLYLELNKRQ